MAVIHSAVSKRIKALDWEHIREELHANGLSVIQSLLSAEQCDSLLGLYAREDLFRKRIVMQRYNYGRGEYQYFNYPLPSLVLALRKAIYPQLVPVANQWNALMKLPTRYPDQHAEFLSRCHKAGQTRPTPLMLKYQEQDFNCLHQDLYGEHLFPLQVTFLLSAPEKDFRGGEFILTEQRPRMQSRPEVVPLHLGDAVVFAVNQRPVQGTRGNYRVTMRHGVSRISCGDRYTLGIIFHDAA
jgi:uncharacterized protein